ncbi:MAG: TspO/MBR family protein [Deltaproteobacteria bacterium]
MVKDKAYWKKYITGSIISILIAEAVGVLSALFTQDTMQQYKQLIQPPFSPPGWVFPIVWSILFLLMGLASYRVYNEGIERKDVKNALVFYAIQLILNLCWTIIFFRFQMRGFAFVWLLILLTFIIITTIKFYKIDKVSAYLMIPYILWVAFAGVLNFSIWQLNK